MSDFEFIEHTADVGIRAFGKNEKVLFESAARALFSLLVDRKPQPSQKKEISLEADNLEELFVRWLNELIVLFFMENMIPATYSIVINNKGGLKRLEACIKGEVCDLKGSVKMEVKAATYHNLKIKKNKQGYVAEVILDV